ncbi:histidine phosphatase family protein [Texcoconibacillus texcoconensis]|uniref:Putative phosphatase n=1 Tax=Texcoconibacillus texcoconensis TaxID=1095777 RepID=A0A840QTM8_9BACI|nr:histidine phosphatase family protein [Texcoconibacillus texcoconensis]MBB5174658.1 putative phosphatase [Texcoconibacillus texcoconensis]
MLVYLIRHGQSEANVKGVIQGHQDFPLTELGEQQASLVADAMKDVSLDAIYASDLMRAYHTAREVENEQQASLSAWELIREVGLGPLEGKTRAEMLDEYPDLHVRSLLTSGIDGTESIEDITFRCQNVLNALLKQHKDDTVALVSHGGFISIFLLYLIAGEQWHQLKRPFIIGNTGISKVEMNDEGFTSVHFVNRTDHLERGTNLTSSTVVY